MFKIWYEIYLYVKRKTRGHITPGFVDYKESLLADLLELATPAVVRAGPVSQALGLLVLDLEHVVVVEHEELGLLHRATDLGRVVLPVTEGVDGNLDARLLVDRLVGTAHVNL